ncbi:MAG: SIS domain-containing protein [Candidatus Neomarinimicrobiota bacterium]
MQPSKDYLIKYLNTYNSLIKDSSTLDDLIKIKSMFQKTSNQGGKIILAGNGGSAAMASHVAVDITKNAGIRAVTFNEYDLITTLANDFGYENWISKAIELYYNTKDIIVLISASGQSLNVLNAAIKSKEFGLSVITFSGFNSNNPLRKLGEINLWVDSNIYNIVEMTHHIWLLAIVDMIINGTI